MYSYIQDTDTKHRYRKARLAKPYAGKYGEFVDFTGTFQWSSDELSLNSATYALYIDGPEGK